MAMKEETKQALFAQVTEGLIAEMEKGVAIWQKPWVTTRANGPQNGNSKRPYTGFNRVYLGWIQAGLESSDPRWFTFDGAGEAGGKVRKGEKSTIVVYNKAGRYTKEDEDTGEESERTYWLTRYYRVWHASQIDGLSEYEMVDDTPVQPDADEDYDMSVMVDWCRENLASPVQHGGDRACYVPQLDMITLPYEEDFLRKSWYAQTLAHEVIHATGHESRLDRLTKSGFGTDEYAKEELIAEFGAAILCGSQNIPTDMEQSAAYLKGWAKRCKDEPNLLISAVNAAEYAVTLVLEDVYATA